METLDPNVAERVWQRVHNRDTSQDLAAALLGMITAERNDGAVYLQLSRKYQGRESAMLRRLFEEEQSHTACLKGIYMLLTGQKPAIQALKPASESIETTLRKCYGREMRCLAQYEQWSTHREYGPVFSRMAEQEREHCRILLQLLGREN